MVKLTKTQITALVEQKIADLEKERIKAHKEVTDSIKKRMTPQFNKLWKKWETFPTNFQQSVNVYKSVVTSYDTALDNYTSLCVPAFKGYIYDNYEFRNKAINALIVASIDAENVNELVDSVFSKLVENKNDG